MIRVLISLVVVVSVITRSSAYSDGGITHPKVCNQLTPNHGFEPVDAKGHFHLTGKRTGTNIEVDIVSDNGQLTFKGFVIRFIPKEAGKFVGGNTFQCDYANDTVTHDRNNGKTFQAVTFKPNPGFENVPIKFTGTVVHSYTEIYGGLSVTVN